MAASEGHLDAVECLINLGASKEITDQMERSPRDIAAEKEFRDIVHYLDTIPTPRILPSNMAASLALSAHQRFKKSFKKTTVNLNFFENIFLLFNFPFLILLVDLLILDAV